MRAVRRIAIGLMVLFTAASAVAKTPAKDPKITEFTVEYDLAPTREFLYGRIAQYIDAPALKGRGCDAPALRVTKLALAKYDFYKHFLEFLKGLADGVRDGAALAGADTLSKVAQFAGEMVEAFDTDQPEAAIGRALVNNAIDWAVEQAEGAKTGTAFVDKQVKENAKDLGEKAKDKINEALFAGELTKRITEPYSTYPISYCSPATVTVEFQKPGQHPRGGLFILVNGTCKCVPENAAEMTSYQVSWFMPMSGMDAKLVMDDHKLLADLKDVFKSAQGFREGVKKALEENPDDKAAEEGGKKKSPNLRKLIEDLAKKTGNASQIRLKLILTPRFDMPPLDQVQFHTTCGCPRGTSGTTAKPPTAESTPPSEPYHAECEQCDGLLVRAEKLEEDARAISGRRDAAAVTLRQAQADEQAARRKLAGIANDPRFRSGANPGQRKAAESAAKSDLDRALSDIKAAQAELQALEGKPEAARTAAAAARDAYERCIDDCKHRTRTGEEPQPGQIDRCLVGRWVSTKFSSKSGHTGFTGILLTYDEKGLETIDYSKAEPRRLTTKMINGPATWTQDTFRGIASGHVATHAGKARRLDITANTTTDVMTTSQGLQRTQKVTAGPAFLGIEGLSPAYTCKDDVLQFDTQGGFVTFTFERIGGKTQTGHAAPPH